MQTIVPMDKTYAHAIMGYRSSGSLASKDKKNRRSP